MTRPPQPFILASASPRRVELLAQIGLIPTQIVAAEIDETPQKAELPAAYALRIAQEKALKVASLFPNYPILAADTVVACGRRILGKADDERMARLYLELLSGRRHRVYTAICLYSPPIEDSKPSKAKCKVICTQVRFKRLTTDEISDYLASGEWKDKAGAYAIQGRAAAFVPWISGSYSNVVGLPLAEVTAMLNAIFRPCS
jgi:septum formation protein